MTLITTYSAWLLLPVTIGLGVFVYYFYYRHIKIGELSITKAVFLSVLRFATLFLIAFLLFEPLIKSIKREVQKPVIIFAVDNSHSMVLSSDSAFIKSNFIVETEKTLNKFTADYTIDKIQFGDSIWNADYSFTDKVTNFNPLFDLFNTRYYNRNIGALIIVSDGIFNQGYDPNYLAQNLPFPIYTVPFGDTLVNADIEIVKVDYNRVVQKGNRFPVLAGISAVKLKNTKVDVTVFNNGKLLQTQKLKITSDNFYGRVPFYLTADTSGIEAYSIQVQSVDGESNIQNNTKKIFVEVDDTKKSVLLLQNGYHPDVAVFERIIGNNPAFKLDVASPKTFAGKFEDYNLVILHRLPSDEYNLQQILPKLNKLEIPLLFILGSQTNLQLFNSYGFPFKINQNNRLFDEVFASLNSSFSLFNVSISEVGLSEMPPLLAPFGEYANVLNSNTLLTQRVGQVQTRKPLWAFSDFNNQKIGIIMGEGIWRWRILEYKKFRDHSITDELITKTVQYLSVQNRKDSFTVDYPKIISEGENFLITAKPFNKSNEIIKGATINFELYDAEGNLFPHRFNESAFDYTLNLTAPGVGKYSFVATVEGKGASYIKKGTFVVNENRMEQTNLVANYQLLYQLAANSGGKMIDSRDFDSVFTYINRHQNIAPVVYLQKSLEPLIHLKYIFIVLLLMVTLEWFLRKYWGLI